MTTVDDVLNRRALWCAVQGDAIARIAALPDDSIDLLFTSPPYELARTYGIAEKMVGATNG